jgi:hypothetical protein
MTAYRWVVFALAVVLASACSRVQVSQDYRETADFSQVRSYAWTSDVQEKTGDIRVDSPLMDERIRAAVAANLSGRGMRPALAGQADVQVRYDYQIRQKIRSDDTRGGLTVGYGAYSRGGGIVLSTGSDVKSYDEGLLVIDLLSSEDGELLWRGNATFAVPEHSTPEKITGLINEAVEKTLAQFPPAVSK